eukprot:CAMPEP_0181185734 /NCGR_PEP_ID=MMETSP1096-20121128/9665_1 /TAXON_ID=156174 ORGANISM="Chrysochromulina ericina, Strain CCMP281" /NCGR_SAMPLE_ID=MMETSP1096 /ASSEMBLY_ACC=CAM_ASM_000453 /LENGTH=106 /DNA_ID=CAMNT_0023274597 /DNA_START=471 /DNA_END=789 /DNA_ORIENTATION=+
MHPPLSLLILSSSPRRQQGMPLIHELSLVARRLWKQKRPPELVCDLRVIGRRVVRDHGAVEKNDGTAKRVPETSGSTSCMFSHPELKTTAEPLLGESGVSTRLVPT